MFFTAEDRLGEAVRFSTEVDSLDSTHSSDGRVVTASFEESVD